MKYEEWIKELKGIEITRESAESIPGLKLLHFYENMGAISEVDGLPRLNTSRTQIVSNTLKELETVTGSVITKWLMEWEL